MLTQYKCYGFICECWYCRHALFTLMFASTAYSTERSVATEQYKSLHHYMKPIWRPTTTQCHSWYLGAYNLYMRSVNVYVICWWDCIFVRMYMSIRMLKVFAYILLPVPKMCASSSAAGGLLANGSVTQLRPELQWRHVAHRTGRNACWINEICVHVLKRDNETRTTNRHKQNSKQTEKTSLKTSSTKMTTTTRRCG